MDLPVFYKPKYFKPHELLPPETMQRFGESGLYLFIDIRVLIVLDTIRTFFGAPVTVNNWSTGGKFKYRGYRPDSYYAGAVPPASQHRFGRAADLDIKGVTAVQARDIIMNHQPQFPFIKRIEDDVDWIHVDVANTFHNGIHLFKP